jgi:hypothetical protein
MTMTGHAGVTSVLAVLTSFCALVLGVTLWAITREVDPAARRAVRRREAMVLTGYMVPVVTNVGIRSGAGVVAARQGCGRASAAAGA